MDPLNKKEDTLFHNEYELDDIKFESIHKSTLQI